MKNIRQFCALCGLSTTDYTTVTYDQRTPAERAAGKPAILRRFHYCTSHGIEATAAQQGRSE